MVSQLTPKRQAPAPRCPTCGASTGLVLATFYVGGHGYRTGWQCRDLKACWARYDEAHAPRCECCGRRLRPGEGKVCWRCAARVNRGLAAVCRG